VAAPAIVRRLPPRLVILTFGWLACGATFLLLPVRSPYVLGALGAVAFVLLPSVNAIAFGSVSEQAPESMQGRATSAAIQIAMLAAPIGPFVAGVLLGRLGTSTTLLVYGCALAALAAIASMSRGLRA